jgi:uncharacterized protein
VVVAWAAGFGRSPQGQTFGLVFSSIVIEALPFILLGGLVAGAIGVYVPARVFDGIARLPLALQLPGAALSGVAFPVCECGSVPVARRLITRGLHPAAGIAFMLAAPIVNPIVIASTWIAYGGGRYGGEMVIGRTSLGLVTAVVVAYVVGRTAGRNFVRPRAYGEEDHVHVRQDGRRVHAFAGHVVSDFLFMGKFIVLGAGLSALLQTALPASFLSSIGGAPVLSAAVLMAVAFVLSLCSEADAFIAASFTGFSPGAQLAFLVSGPMVDMKLAVLYGATFQRSFAVRLLLVGAPIIVVGSLAFDALLP